MNSSIFTLNWKDLGKGIVMAVLGSVVTSLLAILNSGALPTLAELKAIGIASAIIGGTYLLKNLFTNNEGAFLKANVE